MYSTRDDDGGGGDGGFEQRAPPIFGRAAITLGIGPHSSCECFFVTAVLIIMAYFINFDAVIEESVSESRAFVNDFSREAGCGRSTDIR